MRKSILFSLLLINTLIIAGCSNKIEPKIIASEPKTYTFDAINDPEKIFIPFVLGDVTTYSSPFVLNGTSLVFPNRDDNNNISIINEPYPETLIKTKDVVDYFNNSTDTLALINNVIYFANGSDGNHLSSTNLEDKILNNINNHNVHDIIPSGDNLFYLSILPDHKKQNKLYSYNTVTNDNQIIITDTVGKYLINGDFIIYQNISDNSKLYSIKTDGSQKEKLTDYSVDSFAPFENQLLILNSSDNNNLYVLDPLTDESKRLALMNGENLKVYNNKLYFININNSNSLYSLTVNLETSEVTFSLTLAEGINNYYPTDAGIFLEKRINVNNTYLIPLTT
ncbi:DUF5050 domain-containing protein [Clostridium vincentii]|uniref:Prolow-density lipoprotein receptor-related protein 1-like beta-propeller domain-containing protein n=1 Tax=Clostridium vincentii TaxID=52704 RepID=A0A2T0B860_9CLOT|nr:DUF5050 domain-containing protein [Clostridium vincentii]PRR80052.1 hypothetical protein CLVI_31340 [Clostridium vincentii]